MFKFKASDLPEILTRWSARYSVFVPSGSPDNAQMRIWSRRTRKEVRFMEPDEYTNLIVAPKGFVFGEREELFRWEGNEKTCTAISAPSSSSLQEEDKILFGLRPCDTYGLAYMDRFFLGEHHDINYHLRRGYIDSPFICAAPNTKVNTPHRIRQTAASLIQKERITFFSSFPS